MVHHRPCQRIVVLLVLVTILRKEPDVNVFVKHLQNRWSDIENEEKDNTSDDEIDHVCT